MSKEIKPGDFIAYAVGGNYLMYMLVVEIEFHELRHYRANFPAVKRARGLKIDLYFGASNFTIRDKEVIRIEYVDLMTNAQRLMESEVKDSNVYRTVEDTLKKVAEVRQKILENN